MNELCFAEVIFVLLEEFISKRSLIINSCYSDKNFKEEIIKCGRKDECIYRSYIYFDLSPLPENLKIISAKLYLYLIERLNPSSLYSVGIYPILDDFGHFTTYNFQPKIFPAPINYHLIYKIKGKTEFNLTDIVNKWRSGILINKGLLIKGEECKLDMLTFGSAYNKDYLKIPKLEIAYSLDFSPAQLQSIVKYFDYETTVNYIDGNVKTQAIDFSHLIQATVFIKNLGSYDVTVSSQYSPDNITWTQDFPKKISSNNVSYIIPKIYSKYYRLNIESTGSGTLKIYISYLIYA